MRIKERLTAAAIAAMAVAVVGAGQTAVASADDVTIGEYTVGGRILDAYKATGGQEKWGAPTSNELPAADFGRFQTFEKDTAFYWKASVSGGVAHQIGGAIRVKWGSKNFERGALKWPTTDELDAAGKGRKQFFQGGNIYYGASTGTHIVWGEILNKYAARGGPASTLGLPTGDEYRVGNRFGQNFQGGQVFWP
ncbi:LGFP repeat-containing protein [Williamsia deligens]|uniref:LGFP repeat-containing protein n=1 Tax=Williamsia deligens TaxID=321325 RepID=A0ABW3G5C0_9NOCA|nr:lysozyme [Williamsia deligens]MCP2193964.1 LGFP repeat-containing protein [Williamsia deligens]